MAKALKVVGLMNVQYAIKKEDGQHVLYVIEVNPRASRTVPFVAKATGLPVAKIAAKVMAGMSLAELGVTREPIPAHVSIKESVFPFRKFAGVDIVLGPEMRSTGEVMGVSERFSLAFAKSQLAAGVDFPTSGTIFVSVSSRHKHKIEDLARRLDQLGFNLIASQGTAQRLQEGGIPVTPIKKLAEGHPNLIDYLKNEEVDLVLNTPSGKGARTDERKFAPPPFNKVFLASPRSLQQKQLSPRWKHCARKRWMCKRYRIDLNLEIHRPVKVLFLTRNQVCLTSKSLPDLDMNLKPSTTGRYWLNTASRPTSVTPASPNHSPPITLDVCSFNVPKMTTKRPSG